MENRSPFLFVLSILIASVGPGLRAQPSGEETIVRVFFDDLTTARRIAAGLEPIEAKYEKGYLVVEVTPEQLQRLQQRGLRTEPVSPQELSEMLAPPSTTRLDRTHKQSATPAVKRDNWVPVLPNRRGDVRHGGVYCCEQPNFGELG